MCDCDGDLVFPCQAAVGGQAVQDADLFVQFFLLSFCQDFLFFILDDLCGDGLTEATQGVKRREDLRAVDDIHGRVFPVEGVVSLCLPGQAVAGRPRLKISACAKPAGIGIYPTAGNIPVHLLPYQILGLMASDLFISFSGHGAVQQVHTLEDSVGAEAPADLQHGSLDLSLPRQGIVICKQVQLIGSAVFRHLDGVDAESPVEEPVVCSRIELGQNSIPDHGDAVGGDRQAEGPVAVFRMEPAVKVDRDLPVIFRAVLQALIVVADPPGDTPADDVFFKHLRTEELDHLRERDPGLWIGIGLRQDLAVGNAVVLCAVALDVLHGHRLDPPGMVDQDLSVDAEVLIEKAFIPQGPGGDVSHRIHLPVIQPEHGPGPDLPEVASGWWSHRR